MNIATNTDIRVKLICIQMNMEDMTMSIAMITNMKGTNMKGTNILTKVIAMPMKSITILIQNMLMRAIPTMLTIMKVMDIVMCMERVLLLPGNRLKLQA